MRIEDLERGDYISYYGGNATIIGFELNDNSIYIRPDNTEGWVATQEQCELYGIAPELADRCWYIDIEEVEELISSASKYPRIKTQFLGGLCFK